MWSFVAVAIDSQGAPALGRFVEPVAGAFPVLVDEDNLLGETFGFKALPNGIFVDPEGRVDAIVAGGFDIRKPEMATHVARWLDGAGPIDSRLPEVEELSPEARSRFLEAVAALRNDDRPEAIRQLRRAALLEPDNLIIRKQLWAIEHPDRFYAGEIDRDWQQEQLAQGR